MATQEAKRATDAGMAGEICGECVPRTYADNLRTRMDLIQQLGYRLTLGTGAAT